MIASDVKVQLRGKARELACIMCCRKKHLIICLKIIQENITLSGRGNADLYL